MNNELVKSFIQKRDEYDVLCDVAQTLIINTLNEHDISVFDVKGRVKDVSSLAQKIERKKYENKIKDEEYRNYKELEDITDLCGIRIITYYSDEVDLVAQLIERELKIDKENSIDKRNTTLPGSFGYSSLHYVVEIDDARAQLEEYNIIKGMKFEIQIRTVMEHNWAEIEHDLNYKSKDLTEFKFKRRFARLASLIELADDEFVNLRKESEQVDLCSFNENNVCTQGLQCFTMHDPMYMEFINRLKQNLPHIDSEPIANAQGHRTRELQLEQNDYYTFQEIRDDLLKYEPFIAHQVYKHYQDKYPISDSQPILYMMYAKACDINPKFLKTKFGLSNQYIETLMDDFKLVQ
ncbi:MAG: hypothetical protein RR543_02890 [Erysipelotrichales bacterium]